MYINVYIRNGELFRDGVCYKVYYKTSQKPFTHEYIGQAWVEGTTINFANGRTEIVQLVSDEYPTKESADRYAGRMHAINQKRRREPKNVSYDYMQGWSDCWEEKKNGTLY